MYLLSIKELSDSDEDNEHAAREDHLVQEEFIDEDHVDNLDTRHEKKESKQEEAEKQHAIDVDKRRVCAGACRGQIEKVGARRG